MGEAFIVRRGGGIGKAFAAISVTYPAGSICTATNEHKTVKAKDITGAWLFLIPEGGTWVITAENTATGKKTSKSISVQANTVYTVKLSYMLVLFDGTNGGDNTTVTGGFTRNGYTQSGANITSGTVEGTRLLFRVGASQLGVLGTANSIDLSPYSQLKASVSSNHLRMRLGASPTKTDFETNASAQVVADENAAWTGEKSVDISTVNNGFVFVDAYSDQTTEVFKIWLE